MRTVRYILLLLILEALAMAPAWSQGTSSLSGTVTDSSGAVVPGVTVILVNQATNASRTITSSADGSYSFTLVPPGTYKVEFQMQGFKTAIRNDVALPIGTTQVLNVSLDVGEITSEVVVEGGAVKINTTDASIGNPFLENQVRQLPLEARNPSQLLSLQAGVVWAGEQLNDERAGSVFGGRGNQGNITLDGADVNDQVNQRAMESVLPIPLDSVQEFRVTTMASGAQFGRSSGAQVELVTKGGSNDWHGSAYWFNRNEKFASNGFMENRLGIEKAPLKRNIYGASFGGPVKKNRVFFFVNWEGRKDRTATPETRVVPTDSFRDGVLMYQCSDPTLCPGGTVAGLTSNHTVPAGWYGLSPNQIAKVIDPCGSAPCVDVLGRSVTPGVNQSIISLMRGYPHGNDPSLGSIYGLDNGYNSIGYRFNPPITLNNNDYVARLDFNIDQAGKHAVYVRGSLANDSRVNSPQWLPNDPLTGEPGAPVATLLNNSKGMAVSYTAIFRPTLVNTFRYGITRQGLDRGGTYGTELYVRGFDEFRDFGTRPFLQIVPTHSFTDDMTWTKGKHTIQFGGAVRLIDHRRTTYDNSFDRWATNNGWFASLGRNCVLPGRGAVNCPNAAALNALPLIAGGFQTPFARATIDMLGVLTEDSGTYQFDLEGNAFPFGTPQAREFITREFEGYIQDTFRLKNNLTVTFGVRYSYGTVPYEKNGLEVIPNLDLGTWMADRIAAMEKGTPSDASPLITYIPGGKANNAPSYFNPDRNNFAPRASVAYSPGFSGGLGRFLFGEAGKSSIRGGFSIVYDRMSGGLPGVIDSNGAVGLASSIDSPYGGWDYVGNPATGTDTAPRFTGYNNLPATGQPFFTPPVGGFPNTPPSDTQSYGAAIIRGLRTPYSPQISFSIEREVYKGLVVDVGYVGRFGRSLLIQGDYAQPLRFRDPATGVNTWEAWGELEKNMHTSDLSYDGVCLTNPAACPVIPFFENVYSGMAAYWSAATGKTFKSNTAAVADYAASTWAPGWADVVKDLDVNIPVFEGTSVYNKKYDPEGDGRILFPQQYTVLPVWNNQADSSYNALVITVRRRLGSFVFDANYSFAKSMDDGSALEGENSNYSGITPNNFDPHPYRAVSDFDVRHNFNANWLYNLPIGRGKYVGASMPGWADQIIGGWQVTGVWRWRSGFPVEVANGFWFPTTWDNAGTATRVTSLKTEIQKSAAGGPNLFVDPVDDSAENPFKASSTAYAAYIHTPMGGSGSRNTLRAGSFFTIDLGIGKSFRMPWEGHKLQFRWEIFNLTNSVNFASTFNDLSLDLDSVSSFGRIINTASSASQSYPLVPHNRVMQFGLRYDF